MKKLIAALLSISFFGIQIQTANATTVVCTYKVAKITHHPAGIVYASLVNPSGTSSGYLDAVQLCSLESPMGGIGINTCKAMFSTLMAAKTTQTPVVMWFDKNPAFDCQTTMSWKNLESESGWYFGPSIE